LYEIIITEIEIDFEESREIFIRFDDLYEQSKTIGISTNTVGMIYDSIKKNQLQNEGSNEKMVLLGSLFDR
jgi:hypothetical protein